MVAVVVAGDCAIVAEQIGLVSVVRKLIPEAQAYSRLGYRK
jgi:hypothetical protein